MKRLITGAVMVALAVSFAFAAPSAKTSPLADARVRQAIKYAIDMKTVVDTLMSGKAVVANSLTPNGEWKLPGLAEYAYNPEKARQLLKEAKWDPNYVLDVVYYYGDQMTVDFMTAVQSYLADVGMKMTFRKLEGDLGAQLWVPPSDPVYGPSAVKWDMAYAAVAALALDEYYDRFLPGGASNSHTPKDATLESLINATKVVDPAAQKKAYFKLQQYESDTMPSIPLYYQQVFVVSSTRLNRAGAAFGNEQYNYDWNIVKWEVPADSTGKKVLKTNGGPVSFIETPFLNPGLFMSMKVLFDHLIVADADLSDFKPQLATYKVSPDGREISFTLKNGIKWHDGSAITAEDVKWTYEFAAKVPAIHAVFGSMLKAIDGYQDYKDGKAAGIRGIKISGNTVTFSFPVAFPNALLCFSQFPPLPKKYLANVDPLKFQQDDFWQKPVGSGPFMVKTISMGNYATFVPFKEYHDGVAKIDEIQMYPSGESDPNLVKNAAAKQLDYAYTKSIEDVLALEKMSHLKVTPVNIRYTRLFFVNKFPKP